MQRSTLKNVETEEDFDALAEEAKTTERRALERSGRIKKKKEKKHLSSDEDDSSDSSASDSDVEKK